MPDRLTEILTVHLVVEDASLQALRGEILDLCQHAAGADRAVRRLEQCVDHDAAHLILNRVPWYHIYLAYACCKQPNLPASVQWASLAVDSFDQLDHAWNRAIARWFCALLHRKTSENEEASLYFEEAIKLMRREIIDLKRRSFYERAGQCEKVLALLLADAASPPAGGADHAPSASTGGPGMDADDLDGLDDLGNFSTLLTDSSEEELYWNLLTKVSGDQQTAERLIEYERSSRPGLTRKDSIIRAIEAWERQNR